MNLDAIHFVGDVNARIGSLSNISDLDNLVTRKYLEEEINNHGKAFIEFLHDIKCCIVNGRINPDNDNFTSISTKGKVVIDYVFVPHDTIETISEFYVDTCSTIVNCISIDSLFKRKICLCFFFFVFFVFGSLY